MKTQASFASAEMFGEVGRAAPHGSSASARSVSIEIRTMFGFFAAAAAGAEVEAAVASVRAAVAGSGSEPPHAPSSATNEAISERARDVTCMPQS
ncbi:MAG: hypothetical protein HZA52_20940 [Planctomycetes bacterium]|nr:hypothetical protein [Planctomycetota bacterium]